ncbi:COP9 signalosome complex subunit 6-like [Paramacrobiotus metropolitanus]|uniref:COP9 signalosome complex subunit 6-like n=1 Tax=Paramacrobiotus metropolitanus TaxID=2943436 RepID=UPI002445D844|nr:COP9 signalosome complex subunit 6-like [Paramacrobiotus metropolitanus]
METLSSSSAENVRLGRAEQSSPFLTSSTAKANSVVDLHPVVLLHIADHHHRNVAQHGNKFQIFGALLGRQDGPKVEICFAFEIRVNRENGRYILDKEYWFQKEEQFKQILPGLDYIGWYTVADDYLTVEDVDLQNQLWEVCQNLFFLKAHANKADSFPVDLFESVVEFTGGSPVTKFNPIAYNIVFEQAEQIGVHHVATKTDADSGSGSAGAETEYQISMRSMSSAVHMLQDRLSVLCQYMVTVEQKQLPPDNDILVELKRIVEMLQSLDSEEQQEKYNVMKLQALMTASVGNYTQSVELLIEFIRKNIVIVEKKGPSAARGGHRFGQPQPGFSMRGMSKGPKPRPSMGQRFRPGNLFGRNRGDDSSDGPSGSMSFFGRGRSDDSDGIRSGNSVGELSH